MPTSSKSAKPRAGASRARARTGGQRRGRPVVALTVAVLAVLAVVAVAVTALTGDEPVAEAVEVADVEVTGEPLPPLPAQGADPAVGMPAPTLGGVTPVGGPAQIEPGGGEPTLVVVGAHWCPHCQAEIPEVVDWLEAGGAEGVDVVAVSTAADENAPNWPPSAWWEREGWDRPVLVDSADQAAVQALGVSGYPFFVLVDAEGEVVARWAGEVGTEPLEEAIAALDG